MKNASKIWRITHAKTPVSNETGVFIDKKEQDLSVPSFSTFHFSRELKRRSQGSPFQCARCVIFPGRRQPSIVTVNELNYCVRNGNRCTLVTNSTHLLFFSGKEKRIRFAPHRRFCFLYLSRNSISLSHQTDFVKTENGDPCGIRTHVNGVRGRCLNHLTNGPHSVLRSA